MQGIEAHKYLLGDSKLLPCPFCGGEAYIDSCDRLIQIGCQTCGYHRAFHGLCQSEFETPVVSTRSRETGRAIEWYDKDAYQSAVKAWNRRVTDGN